MVDALEMTVVGGGEGTPGVRVGPRVPSLSWPPEAGHRSMNPYGFAGSVAASRTVRGVSGGSRSERSKSTAAGIATELGIERFKSSFEHQARERTGFFLAAMNPPSQGQSGEPRASSKRPCLLNGGGRIDGKGFQNGAVHRLKRIERLLI